MTRIIHYFVLVFIVFICAEIRNVLFHETPYQSDPIRIWNETTTNIPSPVIPVMRLL